MVIRARMSGTLRGMAIPSDSTPAREVSLRPARESEPPP
jgi:hypothetical protein